MVLRCAEVPGKLLTVMSRLKFVCALTHNLCLVGFLLRTTDTVDSVLRESTELAHGNSFAKVTSSHRRFCYDA